MKTSFTYGSVCSGIEAATMAWHSLDWKPLWFSEIEKFPSRVLEHHYPEVPNLGDMTKIRGMIENHEVEAPDILVGGTPCQAFSFAGLRQSLEDNRGQLTLEFVKLADAIDEKRQKTNRKPSIIVWENVPGVLNTPDNAFGCFLGALAGEGSELEPPRGKWPNSGCVFGPSRKITWRVLDAQFFGLAQRRKRVFVIASAREESIADILIERTCMSGDSQTCGNSWKSITSRSKRDFDTTVGSTLSNKEVFPTLTALSAQKMWSGNQEAFSGNYFIKQETISLSHKSFSLNMNKELVGTLLAGDAQPPAVFKFIDYAIGVGGMTVNAAISKELFPTILARPKDKYVIHAIQGNVIGRSVKAGGNGLGIKKEIAPTLTQSDRHGVLYNQRLNCTAQVDSFNQKRTIARYLTEIECERLQGFPDNFTNIPGAAKTSRYKALGNSMAVPVMNWIGCRIKMIMKE